MTATNRRTIFESLHWTEVPVAGESAYGSVGLMVGVAGDTGPAAVMTAGAHGDEGPWGALALKTVLSAPLASLKGRLTVVFAANPLAIQADARNAPLDSLDLNRSFPGNVDGSHTERLAAALATYVEDSDVAVDLHGGGSWCVNSFVFRFAGSEDLAALVEAPFVVDAPDKPGTLTQFARSHGAKVVAIEMGGRSRDELRWSERISASVQRILQHTGVIAMSEPLTAPPAPLDVGPSSVLRPPVGGVFLPTLREDAIGSVVAAGTELGRVLDTRTMQVVHTFTAPFPNTALMLLRPHICAIEGGAMTYVIAQPEESENT